VHGPISVDEMSFAKQIVAAGVGVGLLPIAGATLGIPRRTASPLVRLLPDYSAGGVGLHVVTPSVRFQSAAVTVLRDFLIEELVRFWKLL
jgi:DNA-binding transcriptional LysR family regulator